MYRYLIIVSILILTLLSGCNKETLKFEGELQSKPIILKYAFFSSESSFPGVQMKKWASEIEKRTHNKVKVELYFSGTLLDSTNMFQGVTNGTADIGLTATTYEPGRFPLLAISDLPSGYPNSFVSSQVVHDLITEFNILESENLKSITSFATEPAYIQSISKINNIDDLEYKLLRISSSLTPLLKNLGASPVGMSLAETAEALQTGVIEGNVSSREVLKDFKLSEHLKYVVDLPLTITTFVAVMNRDTWDSLPKDVQEIIDDLNWEMTQFTGKYHDQQVQESVRWSEEKEGVEIVKLSSDETEIWKDKISILQNEHVEIANSQGLPGDEYKKRLYELIDKYSNTSH